MNVEIPFPPDQPIPTPPLPSRDSVSGTQINSLLSILGTLAPLVFVTARELELEHTARLDGGVVASATTTIMHACDRLDKILTDEARWKLETHDQLYQSILDTQKAQRDLQSSQRDALANFRRPCIQLKPSFARVTTDEGERILAYYGDLADEGSLIMGIGDTPEEALKDFDEAFQRRTAEQRKITTKKPQE